MDWYLSPDVPDRVRRLRREISAYLTRHAEPGSDIYDAELVVEELVGNSVRHTGGPIWVQLSWTEDQPMLAVADLGPGFTLPGPALEVAETDPTSGLPLGDDELFPDVDLESGRGLFLVSHLADELSIAARRAGGTVVSSRLRVRRAASPSFDPPSGAVLGALPTLAEAQDGGGFSRESFLRALVVQLAHAVEQMYGPAAAEAAIAQVGIDVGGQMELEFRLAREVVGQLTPAQLAECFVRLKHAIDGRFYVVEVTDERIVLGNHACPFGDVVRRSPALCRMTSSVFGGITARNRDDEASVVLEERIAVGDPGCRVVVHLGAPPPAARRFAHRYTSPLHNGAPART